MDKIDKSDMCKVLEKFPDQFAEGMEIAKDINLKGSFENIVVCGMGGSGWPAEILAACTKLRVPLIVNKTYSLPKEAGRKSLVIISSFSGNTEEALSCFSQALERKLELLGMSHNGDVEKICKENGIPFVKIPKPTPDFQPRFATGYVVAAMFQVLKNAGLVENKTDDILIGDKLKKLDFRDDAKKLAERLVGRIPVIYTSKRLEALGYVWKIKLNENSKIMAFSNVFPELNHNELAGYTKSGKQGKFHLIFFKDRYDHPREKKRMELTAKLARDYGMEVSMIDSVDADLVTRCFAFLYLGDWVSYYLALENGVDPTPVEVQENFKKRLKEA